MVGNRLFLLLPVAGWCRLLGARSIRQAASQIELQGICGLLPNLSFNIAASNSASLLRFLMASFL